MFFPCPQQQIDFLFWIASWRSEALDLFFLTWNFLESWNFLMYAIAFVWVGLSYKWGMRLAYLTLFSILVNIHLKLLFEVDRPYVDFPELAMLPLRSFSFPSGAAQGAALYGTLLIAIWKNKWAWLIAVPWALCMGFSRLYLGVHYPMDLPGGYAVGILIALTYLRFQKRIENFFLYLGPLSCFFASLLIFICLLIFHPDPLTLQVMGALIGFSIGACFCAHSRGFVAPPRAKLRKFFSGLAAAATVVALTFLIPESAPEIVQSLIVTLWISLGAARLCECSFPKQR